MVPLLAFITFGLLEYGLYWQQDHTFNEAARSAARIGATLAREPGYQDLIIEELEARIESLPQDTVENVTIYKADPSTGDPVNGAVESCTVTCYRFTWNAGADQFDPVSGPEWAALDMAACGEEGSTDYIGVWIKGWYESPTGMLGRLQITESTVLRLEPVPLSQTCEPTT